jgi:hypothetical protein
MTQAITMCDRCKKARATTYQEYRESCDQPHWPNTKTSRCTTCAESLRSYVKTVTGFTILIDRRLEGLY